MADSSPLYFSCMKSIISCFFPGKLSQTSVSRRCRRQNVCELMLGLEQFISSESCLLILARGINWRLLVLLIAENVELNERQSL